MNKGVIFVGLFLVSFVLINFAGVVSAENTCVDSDGGKDYSVQGSSTLYSSEFSDNCVIKKNGEYVTDSNCISIAEYCIVAQKEDYGSLIEHYCDSNGNRQSVVYKCPVSCVSGACSTEKWICTDTDKGQYPNEAGSVYGYENIWPVPVNQQPITKNDECVSTDKVREWNCEDDGRRIGYFDYYCPEGCSNGKCIGAIGTPTMPSELTQCTDSDGICRPNNCLDGERKTTGKCDFNSDLCCIKSESEPEPEEIPEDTNRYIIQSNFDSITFQGMEEGATADTIDAISTWFSNFVDGAFARYYVGDSIENKDLRVSVAEFEGKISFAEFEEKWVKPLKDNSPDTVLDYDGAIEGEDNALMLSTETTSTSRDGSKGKTEVGISWISENKFILINVGDRDSVWTESESGGISTSSDFLHLVSAYQHKFPSTLIPPRGQVLDEKRNDICNFGCKIENDCVEVGYRTSEKYCGLGNELLLQLSDNAQCNNNFECGSNVCVSGQCVETSLIQKILEWFRKLFAGE